MSRENSTFLHRWFEEVWNKGREEAIDEMLDDDIVAHGLTDASGEMVRGKEEFKVFYRNFRASFPDIHVDLEETIAEGEKLAAVCKVTASHAGDGLGFRATNNRIEFSGIIMVRLKGDKIIEAWNYYDFISMFGQMGVLSLSQPDLADGE